MLTKDFLNGQTILKLYDKLGKEVLLWVKPRIVFTDEMFEMNIKALKE